ncbi:response regulator transcription factor [Pseudahrensia aquimaris]|uniref:Response regulator transcription factor n=1 Tax=Pseudahrensia aquimaris TaxID=744461 RepID=A0ABW3FID3_9HYPH
MSDIGNGRTATYSSRLVIIGFGGAFPSLPKRLLAEEYPNLQISEFRTVRETLDDVDEAPELVLIDENCCCELVEDCHDAKTKFGRAQIALAYSGASVSTECLHVFLKERAVDSFLPMDICIDAWLATIGLLLKGGRHIPPDLVSGLLSKQFEGDSPATKTAATKPDCPAAIRILTPRELEILDLVALGHQNKIIAADLGLSENTVKLHLHHIITKLNVSNRTEAAAHYHVYRAAK